MTFAISAGEIVAMPEQPDRDKAEAIPVEYQEFTTLISKSEANRLPPH